MTRKAATKAPAKDKAKAKAPSLYPWRFRTLVFFIGIAFAGLILRLAWIQVIDPDRLRQEGDMRSLRTTSTQAVRGMITDRNGEQLAVSVPVEAVWADPKTVHESGAIHNERAWLALSAVLKLDINTLKHRIANPSKRFVYLQRQVTPAVAEYIKGLKLGGIYLRPEARRFYPTGEISAHFQEIYGADVSRETVSRITERVVAEKDEWCSRPLDRVYAAVFIDATVVKVRDGQVANRAFYVAVGVDLEGGRDVLGIWASPAAEGARYWLSVLTELKNRGVDDVFFLICDGLKGLPDAVGAVWPLAIVQTCVVHLLRNTFRYASKKDWDAIKRDVKPIYTAPSAAAAAAARDAMLDKWEARYPAIRRLWMDAWERFIPFLDYDVEIRRVICTTNAIESLNARFKRSIRARGHFPDEQAALKCMYLTVRSLDPTGKGRIRWSARWKPALNAFAITFADRWPSEGTQQ